MQWYYDTPKFQGDVQLAIVDNSYVVIKFSADAIEEIFDSDEIRRCAVGVIYNCMGGYVDLHIYFKQDECGFELNEKSLIHIRQEPELLRILETAENINKDGYDLRHDNEKDMHYISLPVNLNKYNWRWGK